MSWKRGTAGTRISRIKTEFESIWKVAKKFGSCLFHANRSRGDDDDDDADEMSMGLDADDVVS